MCSPCPVQTMMMMVMFIPGQFRGHQPIGGGMPTLCHHPLLSANANTPAIPTLCTRERWWPTPIECALGSDGIQSQYTSFRARHAHTPYDEDEMMMSMAMVRKRVFVCVHNSAHMSRCLCARNVQSVCEGQRGRIIQYQGAIIKNKYHTIASSVRKY